MSNHPSHETLSRRFWAKVSVGDEGACWLWTGHVTAQGYGVRYWKGREHRAHRIAYELSGGVIPKGMLLRHKCDVKLCCNPSHLEPGTHADNMHDMVKRGRAARPAGMMNGRARLSDQQTDEIRRLRLTGMSVRSVARTFGVSNQHVSRIASGKRRARP